MLAQAFTRIELGISPRVSAGIRFMNVRSWEPGGQEVAASVSGRFSRSLLAG
jgi:hypothetical protein